MPKSNKREQTSPASPPDTLSRSTILILSGYLFGTTAARICPPGLEACSLGAGVIGMIAFAVFTAVAHQRVMKQVRTEVETAAVKLERRIDQHVRRVSASALWRLQSKVKRPHGQYLTVVHSAHSIY